MGGHGQRDMLRSFCRNDAFRCDVYSSSAFILFLLCLQTKQILRHRSLGQNMERRATLGRHPHWAAALRFTRHSRISIPRQRAGKRGRHSWCAFNADIALIFLPAHRHPPRPPSSTSSRQRWNILPLLDRGNFPTIMS